MLSDSRYEHVLVDISWDEVARYIVQDDDALNAWSSLIERHPRRFLFGKDAVAPTDWDGYTKIHRIHQLPWEQFISETRA